MRRHFGEDIYSGLFSICLVCFPGHSTAQKVISMNYSNFFPHLTNTAYLLNSGQGGREKNQRKSEDNLFSRRHLDSCSANFRWCCERHFRYRV